jgi:hypothetical protein
MSDLGSREREPRSRRMLMATMYVDHGAPLSVVIGNISRHGLGARAKGKMPSVGDHVMIMVQNKGENLQGTVCWSQNDRFGVSLARAIEPQVFLGSGGSWEVACQPFEKSHVFDQFRPVTECRRPGLRVR